MDNFYNREIYADNLLKITSNFLEQLSLIEQKLGKDYLINKGLFLMMYSFFEESVREIMSTVLLVFPEKLPKETCTITRNQLGIIAKDKHKVIIENELYLIFINGVRVQLDNLLKILLNKEYKKNLTDKNAISNETKGTLKKIEEISLYRNALIHKGGKVSLEIYEKAKAFKFWNNGNEIIFSPETINIFAKEFRNFFLYLEKEIQEKYRYYADISNIEKLKELWNDCFSLTDSANKFENYWEVDIENDLIIGIKYPKFNCMSSSEELFLSIWRHQYYDVIKTNEFLVCSITDLDKFSRLYKGFRETEFYYMYQKAEMKGNAKTIPKQLLNTNR